MDTSLSYEAAEFSQKRVEVAALQKRLFESEQAFSTLRSQLEVFHARCAERLSKYFVRLAEVRARVTAINMHAPAANENVEIGVGEEPLSAFDPRRQAVLLAGLPPSVDSSQTIRDLYREIARYVHPDRAVDDDDRVWRTALMSRANQAYRDGNRTALQDVLDEWIVDAGWFVDEGDMPVMADNSRRVADIRKRLKNLEGHMAVWEGSDIVRAMRCFMADMSLGRDPFKPVVQYLERALEQAVVVLRDHQGTTLEVLEEDESAMLPERLYRSLRGEPMRYVAETKIAEVLHECNLDYRYEQPIVGTVRAGIRRPSFAFKAKQGRWLVWQHCAATQTESVDQVAQRHHEWYKQNGYVFGINLFLTKCVDVDDVDMAEVRRIADYLKAILEPRLSLNPTVDFQR